MPRRTFLPPGYRVAELPEPPPPIPPDIAQAGFQGARVYYDPQTRQYTTSRYVLRKQRGKRVKTAGQMTRLGRTRDINAYLRANPGATREEAQRVTARYRRQGISPRSVLLEQARKVPIVSTQGYTTEYRSNMASPVDADRAWAHYFAVLSYLEGQGWISRMGGSYHNAAALRLQQWGREPIEARTVRNIYGQTWILETDLNRLNAMGQQYDLSASQVSQDTGSDVAIRQEAAAA